VAGELSSAVTKVGDGREGAAREGEIGLEGWKGVAHEVNGEASEVQLGEEIAIERVGIGASPTARYSRGGSNRSSSSTSVVLRGV
jgi:hypothetical protein